MNSSGTKVEGQKPDFNYGRLRSWYLATLRKRIIDMIQSGALLTPSARIIADREAVYKLVAAAADSDSRDKQKTAEPNAKKIFAIALAIPSLCHLPVIVLLLYWKQAISPAIFWSFLGAAIIDAIIFTIVLAK